eukprot:scaffold967_cov173-Ochromonas_danica.AAC.2
MAPITRSNGRCGLDRLLFLRLRQDDSACARLQPRASGVVLDELPIGSAELCFSYQHIVIFTQVISICGIISCGLARRALRPRPSRQRCGSER